MKKISLLLSLLISLCLFTGCAGNGKSDDIVILFTNDIHSVFNENLDISQVVAYKEKMENKCNNVTLVDCGDAIQGSYLGLISKGEIMVEIMNKAGYEYAVFGNHEFDFTIKRLDELIDKANYQYLCANIFYTGDGENYVADIEPYDIKSYGNKKVAYIGIDTPYTISSSTPTYFKENDEFVYNFVGSKDEADLVKLLQDLIDEVKQKGADYVVVLGHIGNDVTDTEICSSTYLINNTNGIDLFLDGHAHNVFTHYSTKNKDGNDVVCASTGTKLQSLGQAVISEDGIITVSNITDLVDKNEQMQAYEEELIAVYDKDLDQIIGKTTGILMTDENGIRLVRNRETGLSNLVADSMRYVMESDIAFNNGGGVRESLKAGEISYRDAIKALPFGNMLCKVELTGQKILDFLEYTVKDVQKEYKDNEKAIGESGSFPCLSGLKITVDTSIPTSVVVDENDELVSVGDTRRVVECLVEKDGEYTPIDPNKTYTFACTSYVAIDGGSGAEHIMEGVTFLIENSGCDYQALVDYIVNELHGDLTDYEYTEGRITIK